jgi:Amt family ammonium transporter
MRAIAGLVAITAPCAYVATWASVVIGLVAGCLMVATVFGVEQRLRVDDPIGAIAAHGMGGIWGTLSAGLFTLPGLATVNGIGGAGLLYGGGVHQLGVQALGVGAVGVFVFATSYASFWLCQRTIGLRVAAEQEIDGLDLHEHGRWGLPELRRVSSGEHDESVVGLLDPAAASIAEAFDWRNETPDQPLRR